MESITEIDTSEPDNDLTNVDNDDNTVTDYDSNTVTNDSSSILYITLICVVAILLIWIWMSVLSEDEIINILGEMKDSQTNLDPVTDKA